MAHLRLALLALASVFLCLKNQVEGRVPQNGLDDGPYDQKCHLEDYNERMSCKGITGEALSMTMVLEHTKSTPNIEKTLRQLDIHRGNTPIIRRGTFKLFSAVTQLTLHNMSIRSLEGGAFEGLDRLKLVDLSHNLIRNIPSDMFLSTGIKNLRLDSNPLSIPTNAPLFNAPRLQWLSMKSCNIEHFPGVAFSKIPHLSHLDLSNNLLQQLPEVIFKNTSLSHLYLSGNKFQTLNPVVFQNVPSYPMMPRVVVLTGNPWHCDCNLAVLATWLAEDMETHYLTSDPARSRLHVQTSCVTPVGLAGVSWHKLEDWKCNH